MTANAGSNYQKDGVEHRANSFWQLPMFRVNELLEEILIYRNLRRRYRKIRNTFIDKDIELIKVNPNDIMEMQIDCKEARSFKNNFDKVPLHSTGKARFNPFYSSGMVKGGDWDIYTKGYEFDRVYRGIKNHFINSVPWEETEYYTQYKLREETYQTKGYAKREIEKTEKLYNRMDKEGYLSRYDRGVISRDEPPYVMEGQWPITVSIGRDGDLIFNNTAHNRLAISKVLDFDEVPVLTVCRHKKWAERNGIKYS